MTTDPTADLVENQFFRPLPNKEAEALAGHMYDRWCSHEAVVAEWVNYIPRKWEELEPDIQRGYRAMALDILSWSNARRDAAVEKWRALLPNCGCTAGRTCKWPFCQQRNVEGDPTFPPDPRDAQIARLTELLKRWCSCPEITEIHGEDLDPETDSVWRDTRAALAQEDTCTCGYDDKRDAEMRRLRASATRAATELNLLRHRMAGQAIPIDIVASLGAIVLGLRQAVEGGRG